MPAQHTRLPAEAPAGRRSRLRLRLLRVSAACLCPALHTRSRLRRLLCVCCLSTMPRPAHTHTSFASSFGGFTRPVVHNMMDSTLPMANCRTGARASSRGHAGGRGQDTGVNTVRECPTARQIPSRCLAPPAQNIQIVHIQARTFKSTTAGPCINDQPVGALTAPLGTPTPKTTLCVRGPHLDVGDSEWVLEAHDEGLVVAVGVGKTKQHSNDSKQQQSDVSGASGQAAQAALAHTRARAGGSQAHWPQRRSTCQCFLRACTHLTRARAAVRSCSLLHCVPPPCCCCSW